MYQILLFCNLYREYFLKWLGLCFIFRNLVKVALSSFDYIMQPYTRFASTYFFHKHGMYHFLYQIFSVVMSTTLTVTQIPNHEYTVHPKIHIIIKTNPLNYPKLLPMWLHLLCKWRSSTNFHFVHQTETSFPVYFLDSYSLFLKRKWYIL